MIDNKILKDDEIRELHGDNLKTDSNDKKHIQNKNNYY